MQVTILRMTPPRADSPPCFALLVSMVHMVGDGYTFYQIQGMLNPACPVQAMVWDRDPTLVSQPDPVYTRT